MKKAIILFITLSAVQIAWSQSDDADVRLVINTAYVGGIHNGGPIDDIRKGFHPSFIMFRQAENNDVKQTTINEWIASIEAARAKNPNNSVKAVARFINVNTVGTSANVTLELFKGDKKTFTDHLLLYKFSDGWRIVGKSFYRHP